MKHRCAGSILFVLFCLIFLGSCSVEKRRYTSGYHIEWNRNVDEVNLPDQKITEDLTTPVEINQVLTDTIVRSQIAPLNKVDSTYKPESCASAEQKNTVEVKKKGRPNMQWVPKDLSVRNIILGSIQTGEEMNETSDVTKTFCISALVFSLLAVLMLIPLFQSAGIVYLINFLFSLMLFTCAGIFHALAFGLAAKNNEKLPAYIWLSLIITILGLVAVIYSISLF